MSRIASAFLFLTLLSHSVGALCAQDQVVDTKPGDQKPQMPPRFETRRDLVLVRVTVTDPLNRFITGLKKENFRLFEDKVEQEIEYFGTSNRPVSVGLILDISQSMENNIENAKRSMRRFIDKGDPRDEYFLITFNNRTALVQDFTTQREEIVNKIAWTKSKGDTALYDALYLGLERIKKGRFDKKALILVSDGEVNSGRYTMQDIVQYASESQAQIYVIGEPGEEGYGNDVLAQVVHLTGGRIFYPASFQQLSYYVDYIHSELRHQYVLGFSSSNTEGDQIRELQVRMKPPEGLPDLRIRHRSSYLAPRR